MVKGINRNVIEISDTGSELFERAILFVKPDRNDTATEHLEASAWMFLKKTSLRRRMLFRRAHLIRWAGYLLALLVGAGLSALALGL
ncbi:MAG: hypothetical protein LBU86_05945 [Oscillospiraceae bacterium]|jgi:hypothetical protein|nr:hypothetical protein [Oscillospiraceae bacterium]